MGTPSEVGSGIDKSDTQASDGVKDGLDVAS